MHIAVCFGHLEVVQFLMLKGADIDIKDEVSDYDNVANWITITIVIVYYWI